MDDAVTPEEFLQELADDLRAERELGRQRMQALGMTEAQVAQLLRLAEDMHAGQLARTERDLRRRSRGVGACSAGEVDPRAAAAGIRDEQGDRRTATKGRPMTLEQRIDASIREFQEQAPDWDTTITGYTVERSRRGAGPGLSVYVFTADGMGFEIELRAGDDVAATLGVATH